jgi:hypothetical protein
MNTLSMVRTHQLVTQTKGELFVLDENAKILFQCFTLELPWRNNERKVSCIPTGEYDIVTRWSQKYTNHLHILDVPNRDFILIHEANFVRQLEGCIAVGRRRIDIDGDGLIDVTESVKTKMELLKFVTGPTKIIIG